MIIDLSGKREFLFFQNDPQKAKKLTWMKKVKKTQAMCRIFNNYFSEAISNLKNPSMINNSTVDSNAVSNSLSIARKLFDQHPNSINIRKKKLDSVLNFWTKQ